MFAHVFNFSPHNQVKLSSVEVFSIFFQELTVYSAVILTFLFILSTLLTKINSTNFFFRSFFNFIKYLNITILGLIFFFVFFKLIIFLVNFKTYASLSNSFYHFSLKFNFVITAQVLTLNGSVLSDVVILLAFSSGLVCVYLLGEKNLSKYASNINIFSIFLVAIIVMVYTTNLLVMFVGFEFLFLPTLYFVYSHGYVERVDKTLKILLYWTLFGAFLVFSSLGYLYFKYKTLNYYHLVGLKFSPLESKVLYLMIFLGFGVKVPVFPFHYWLTKIHVEAPAGFSIFLSGFLVKAAIYCFYFFNLIFEDVFSVQLVTLVALFGVIESSIKMWTQTDFKKLIAFATIQEMNLILFMLINSQNNLGYSLILFILIHGWLSTLMFFLVDIIQKKTSSRNIVEISGLAYTFPELRIIIWTILLLFSGFPLTVKFVIEWQILGNLSVHSTNLIVFVFVVVVVVGVGGFAKQFIILLYGMPRESHTVNSTLSKRDKYLFFLIVYILVFLNILNFVLG